MAEKGLNELCGMLQIAEADIKKGASSSHVMAIQNKPNFKRKGKNWKKRGKAKDKISKPTTSDPNSRSFNDDECFHCNKKGHWKWNYKLYLASLEKDGGSKGTPATLVVHVTDIFIANSYINS